VRYQVLRCPFGSNLVLSSANRQCLGLGEEIGQQQVVVIAQRVQALAEADDIARDQRSLVQQLIQGMLAIGAGSPQ
jgi:hypothetical protein